MQFFHGTNIDFIGPKGKFATASAAIIGLFIIAIAVLGIDWGIDFVGGSEVQFQFKNHVEINQIRKVVEKSNIKEAEIKSYGKDGQFIIRIKELAQSTGNANDKASDELVQILQAGFPDNQVTKLGENTIGPKVGKEMRIQGILAVVLAVIAILIYIAFRFEFVFGLGAVVALVHDVIFALGFTLIIGKLGWISLEFNQSMLAAMLTVVGYSINDTVIIFDRIRENQEKHKGMPMGKLMNLSINETLSRTINTVLTVVMVLTVMVLFAGPVLQGFSFTMLVGIVIGTYSSIYIASSFVIWYTEKFGHKIEAKKTSTAKI